MISVFFPSYWQMRARIAALSADNRNLHQLLKDQRGATARAESDGRFLRKQVSALEAEIGNVIALNCALNREINTGERRRDERGRYCK